MSSDVHEQEVLRSRLQAYERRRDAVEGQQLTLRKQLRELEREQAILEEQVRSFSRAVREFEADDEATVTDLRARRSLTVDRDLADMSRVAAITTVLGEVHPEGMHRRQIRDELSRRGFPDERLGDTSAGLAYLKRVGRVVSVERGVWRLPLDPQAERSSS